LAGEGIGGSARQEGCVDRDDIHAFQFAQGRIAPGNAQPFRPNELSIAEHSDSVAAAALGETDIHSNEMHAGRIAATSGFRSVRR
jgi:hypothetical protein